MYQKSWIKYIVNQKSTLLRNKEGFFSNFAIILEKERNYVFQRQHKRLLKYCTFFQDSRENIVGRDVLKRVVKGLSSNFFLVNMVFIECVCGCDTWLKRAECIRM